MAARSQPAPAAHDGEPAQAEFFAAEWGYLQHSTARRRRWVALQTLTPSTDGQAIEQTEQASGIDSIASSKVEDIAKADSYVRLALQDLAAGKKPAQAVTKPYGCSIKYS